MKTKAIYGKDITAIVKKFNLTEGERWSLEYLADCINDEKNEINFDLQNVLLYGTNDIDKRRAVNALLVYFGAKVQKENDLRRALDKTTWAVAAALKCGSYQVRQWFKGVANYKDRFGECVECSDTFGLNYLEITL